jgi:glycerophosphoryl diester phosphodiesterase
MTPAAAIALPRVIGHRGAAAAAPENTLAGLRAAHDAGARWVEFDVRLSADGAAVLAHDPTLERIAGRKARIAGLTASALAAHGIPSLDDALTLCAALGLGANVEMKYCGRRSRALAYAVAAAIRRVGAPPPVLVSSFRPSLLLALRAADPAIPRGLLMSRLRPGWRGRLRAVRPAALVCGVRRLTAPDCAALKATGLPLAVYTVNDPDLARRLWLWGADAVITDDPARLVGADRKE